jgi:hypothetical protein
MSYGTQTGSRRRATIALQFDDAYCAAAVPANRHKLRASDPWRDMDFHPVRISVTAPIDTPSSMLGRVGS